jgi:hypothetical protein
LAPGVLAALVLADPAVNQCLLATAQAHGIVVRPAVDDTLVTADQRATGLLARLSALDATLHRWRGGDAPPQEPQGVPTTGHPTGNTVTPTAAALAATLNSRSPSAEQVGPPVAAPPHQYAQSNPVAPPTTDMAATPTVVPPSAEQTVRYQLPDAGEVLVALAGDRAAQVVATEVDRVRHPDGALCAANLAAYGKDKDGPLHALRILLEDEARTVSVWSADGFGMFEKRSASKQAEQVCLERGLDASVDWALANAKSGRLDVGVLRMMFKTTLDGSFGQALLTILDRSLRKWR